MYTALAQRRSGPGEQRAGLEERQRHFDSAVLQARSLGDPALVAQLQASAKVGRRGGTVAAWAAG